MGVNVVTLTTPLMATAKVTEGKSGSATMRGRQAELGTVNKLPPATAPGTDIGAR